MEYLNAFIPIDRRLSISQETPLPDKTTGSVLFADISGFSSLTAALAKELGPQRGAEELNHQLNSVYGALIDEVHRYFGSVVGFSGDAISCWFDQDEGSLGTACAFAMQDTMKLFETMVISSNSIVSMHIKVAVVHGSVRRFIVGHADIQLIDVLAGRLLDRMAVAEGQLEKGEIIVGTEIVNHFGDHLKIKEWRTAENGERFAVVETLEKVIPQKSWPEIPLLAAEKVKAWFFKPVYQRLIQGQSRFLSDLRLVAPVFVSFTGIDYDSDPAANEKLNRIVIWVQKILSHYDGHLIQLTMGDKGSYFMIVFGAPVAHEDDSIRAIAAALEMASPPPELHFMREVKIGISKGQVHAGAHGGEIRSTYGICGEAVILSARLMSKAKHSQVLVTSHVVEAAANAYKFKELELTMLKGLAEPVVLYAVDEKHSEATSGNLGIETNTPLFGRVSERALLMNAVQELENGSSHIFLIEGEAGIGKSRLMIELFKHYNSEKIVGLSGSGNAIEVTTAYNAWRSVFKQLFGEEISHGLNSSETGADWESAVARIIHDTPDFIQLAPLLNVVLPLTIPENELTNNMSGSLRAFNTHNLLINLLKREANIKPLLIVIEDAHWLDSASWQLLSRVSQEVTPMLLVVATRPMSPQPPEYSQLLNIPHHQRIQLDNLESEAVEAILCARLGVEYLPLQVASFVHERASGNPFFSEELAFALRDNGLLQIVENKLEIKHQGDLQNIDFPDTVQGVITSRIDQLPAPPQLSLKIASIIGRIFGLSTLQGIHPTKHEKEALAGQLETLCEVDLMRIETLEPELTFFFKHIIIQEVAYNLMTFSQRRSLHKEAAQWYETYYQAVQDPNYPVLAHHWSRAEIADKAIDNLDKAGEQALRRGAYREAIQFLTQAYDLSQQHGIGNGMLQLARWKLNLGIANLKIGNLADSRQNLEASLHTLNRPLPDSVPGIKKGLKRQTNRQFLHRIFPFLFLGSVKEKNRQEEFLIAARAYEHLGQIFYHANDPLSNLYTSVNVLNLAEQVGPSPQLTRAYGQLTLTTMIMNRKRLSNIFSRLAIKSMNKFTPLTDKAMTNEFVAIAWSGIGRWAEANKLSTEAMQISEQIGDHRRWNENISMTALTLYPQGEVKQSLALREKLHLAGLRDNDIQIQGWALLEQAEIALHQERFDDALALIQTAVELGPIIGRPEEIWLYGMLGSAYLHLENADKAREAAVEAYNRLSKAPPTAFYVMEGYACTVEVLLTLWLRNEEISDKETAKDALHHFNRFAAVFSIGMPRVSLWRGTVEWHEDNQKQALNSWRKGVDQAQRLGMLYEAGLLHYELGRHLPKREEPQRHLQQAKTAFVRFEANGRLESSNELIAALG